MGWNEQTSWDMGNHVDGRPARRWYRYGFSEKWYHRFVPFRASFVMPFETIETTVNGDSQGHRNVLANPDFSIHERNVVEWMRECATIGRVEFLFEVAYELMSGKDSILLMTARFSDKKTAMMFKLAFG